MGEFLLQKKVNFQIFAFPGGYLQLKEQFPTQVITFKDFFSRPFLPLQFSGFFQKIFTASVGKKELEEETFYYLGYSLLDTLKLLQNGSWWQYFSYLNESYVKEIDVPYLEYLWEKYHRQFFLPLFSLEKIIRKIEPALIITTNSPRGERAALLSGKKLGIETLAITDGLGNTEQYPLESDYIVISSPNAENRIRKKGGAGKFLLWGNPLWEKLKTIQTDIARKKLDFFSPDWTQRKKIFLAFSPRRAALREWDKMLELAIKLSYDGKNLIIVKFHPGDKEYTNLKNKYGAKILFLDNQSNSYPFLKLADVVIISHSLIGIEAFVLGKKVIVYETPNSLLGGLSELNLSFCTQKDILPYPENIFSQKEESLTLPSNFTVEFEKFLQQRNFF